MYILCIYQKTIILSLFNMNEWMNEIPIFHNTKLHDYDI